MRRILRIHAGAFAAAATLALTPFAVVPARADMHDPAGEPEAVEVEETEREAEIRNTIESRFERAQFVGDTEIRAEVEGSAVTLRGAVTADYEKEEAEEIARSVEGVTSVTNEILVGKGVGAEEAVVPITEPAPGGRTIP